MKRLSIIASLLITFSVTLVAQQHNIKEINNLRYVAENEIIVDSLQRLNLVLPEGVEKPPLLVWIGGGAWSYVNRHMEMGIARALAKDGIAVASVGHRLSTAEWMFPDRKEGVQHPAHVKDVAKACKWLMEQAEKYGYDKEKMFIGGFSSGAHIAADIAMNPTYLEAEGLKVEQFKGIIPISGVYDIAYYHNVFVESENPQLAEQHVEAVFGKTEESFKAASQIYFMDNLKLPMLFFSDQMAYRYTALFEQKIREETEFTDFNIVHVHHLSHGDLWRNLAAEKSIYRAIIVDFMERS
ncbi:MAG: alpha/beta hydrolase [Bacteroidota bacterium]